MTKHNKNIDNLKELRHSQNMHIVVEIFQGESIKTRLPKEKAEKLYRKLRAAGAKADIYEETMWN